MIKRSTPESFRFDEPASSIVNISSRGLRGNDLNSFIKRAGHSFLNDIDKLQPGEIPVHWLAVGAQEWTGANRNGDGFSDAVCREYHDTFTKYGHYFNDHVNKKPEKNYGRIIKSAYHEPMRRIELLIGLNGTEEAARRNGGLLAKRELEKIANGEDLPGSIVLFVTTKQRLKKNIVTTGTLN